MRLLYQKRIQLLLIVVLTTLAYSNTFRNQFVEDDYGFLVSNLTNDLNTAIQSFTKVVPFHEQVTDYRPLRNIFFAIFYSLFKDNTFGYHLVSLTSHLLNVLLVFVITSEIVKKKGHSFWPFFAVLLFGLHPINTESVSYMVTVYKIGFIFFFGAFWLYLKSGEAFKVSFSYVFSLILALAAFFTYELTLTLPILILLYDFCFSQINKRNLLDKFYKYLPYWLCVAFYFFVRVLVADFVYTKNFNYLASSFYHAMLFQIKIMVWYIYLLFLPFKLSYIHTIDRGVETYVNPYTNLDTILSKSIFSPDIWGSVLVLLFIVVLAIASLRRIPLVTFCIAWFFITLIPVSNLVPIGPLLTERYLYLPSFAFALLLSYLIISISRRKTLSLVLLSAILSIYFLRTYTRNFDWRNGEALFKSVVKVYPKSVQGHINLAYYQDKAHSEDAIDTYTKLLEIEPNIWEVRFNLANDYVAYRQLDKAIEEYRKVLVTNPDYLEAYIKLASLFFNNGQDNEALETLTKALNINPLGNKFYFTVRSREELMKGYANVYNLMAMVYEKKRMNNEAAENFSKALYYFPADASLKANIHEFIKRHPSLKSTFFYFQPPGSEVFSYTFFGNYAFSAKGGWNVKISSQSAYIIDDVENLQIELSFDELFGDTTFEEYLQTQRNSLEVLVREGPAKIPNVESAYIRFLKLDDQSRIRFFLLGHNKVVKILVYLADNITTGRALDEFLASIRIM